MNIFDTEIDNKKALKEVRRLLRPIPVIIKAEGNWDHDKDRLVIGCKAGPGLEVSNAVHEIGHLAISSDKNASKRSWGLGYKKWVDCPVSRTGGWYEVNTHQDVTLEAKVWAIQHVLERKIGIGEPLESLISSATFLNGFCFVPNDTLKPDDKIDSPRFRTIIKWIHAWLEQPQFKLDAILAEIKRKKRLIINGIR